MRRSVRLLAALCALALLAVSGNQAITRGYVYSVIGSLFTWSGSAQGWSGSSQVATCGDFYTFVKNDGTVCASSSALLLDSYALAHAVNTVFHSPILANGTFAGGSFSPWTSTVGGSCSQAGQFSGTYVNGVGSALASSGTCVTPAAVANLLQTVSIAGTPTAQTYSFQYMGVQESYGDAVNCTEGFGTVSLTYAINGTTVSTIASPALDGAWHTVSGSTTALVNGANTVKVIATTQGATGSTALFYQGRYICDPARTVSQSVQVTNFTLTATY